MGPRVSSWTAPSQMPSPGGGRPIAEAIDAAIAGFDAKRSSQKVIVLMTDGESHEGDTSAAARRAAEQGVVVYTHRHRLPGR